MVSQTPAWDELIEALLNEEDRTALEWMIGSAIEGGPAKIAYLSAPPRTGKSTLLGIILKVLDGVDDVVIADNVQTVTALRGGGYIFAASDRLLRFDQLKRPERVHIIPMRDVAPIPYERYVQLTGQVQDQVAYVVYRCMRLYKKLGPNAFTSTSVTIGTRENH